MRDAPGIDWNTLSRLASLRRLQCRRFFFVDLLVFQYGYKQILERVKAAVRRDG